MAGAGREKRNHTTNKSPIATSPITRSPNARSLSLAGLPRLFVLVLDLLA